MCNDELYDQYDDVDEHSRFRWLGFIVRIEELYNLAQSAVIL